MKIILIRHGKTAGNLEGRYVGRTDEPLCAAGREALAGRKLPRAEKLFVSPLLRCRETAEILWPGQDQIAVSDLSECDFGGFEMKNYAELNGNADYQAWIDSGGTLPFPGGESQRAFQARVCAAFEQIAEKLLKEKADSAKTADSAESAASAETTDSAAESVASAESADSAESAASAGKSVPAAAFAVHGGTIMAVLAQFGVPKKGYFDWQVKNGEGFTARLVREDGKIVLREIEKMSR